MKPKQVVNRILAMTRIVKLSRQLREIEHAIFALPLGLEQQTASITVRELDLAAHYDPPWMYGTSPEGGEATALSTGADIGILRARSSNLQVRMRGIALWLAVIYHETRTSRVPGAGDLHRQVMRVVRQLKAHLNENDAAVGIAAAVA